MVKRIKKPRKGIESLEKQIEMHKEKRETALNEGRIERANYYEKEISGLEKTRNKKKRQINK